MSLQVTRVRDEGKPLGFDEAIAEAKDLGSISEAIYTQNKYKSGEQ